MFCHIAACQAEVYTHKPAPSEPPTFRWCWLTGRSAVTRTPSCVGTFDGVNWAGASSGRATTPRVNSIIRDSIIRMTNSFGANQVRISAPGGYA